MKSGRIGFWLLLLATLGASPAAGQNVTLTATAGLDGLGRPGRWAPVHVTVDNRGTDLNGVLIVEWGTTRLTQAVALAAPSRRDFELYIRSDDVRDVIGVRLESQGQAVAATEAPIRLAGIDERVTACVGSPESVQCSVALAPGRLPRSWRGYDAIDRVEVGPGLELAGARRAALDLWRRVRQIEEAGNAAPASGLVPPAMVPAGRVRTTLALYVLAMIGAGVAVRRRTRRGAFRVAMMAAVVIAGSAAAMATGRSMPVTVRHATVVQQFEGAPGAILQSRAVAEFPADDGFAITPSLIDTALDSRPGREAPLEQAFNLEGYPVLSGRFGLGGTQPVAIEASGDMRVLDVTREGTVTRVANVSAYDLRDCELPSGFSERTRASFPAGALVETARLITGADPIVACRFSGLPIEFADRGRPVVTDGTTVAVYHLFPAGEAP